jgi:polygalacturonase
MSRSSPFASNRRTFLGLAGACSVAAREAVAAGKPRPEPGPTSVPLDVTRFGAVGDGRTVDTGALQKAIDGCAAAGGGTVLVPPGRFLSGALQLRSHVNLELSSGAVLLASERLDDFPAAKGRHEGIERTVYAALIGGEDLENVSITGRGLIDGRGSVWWQADEATRKKRVEAKMPREAENPAGAALKWPRPRVINLMRCRDVVIEGVTIKDGAGYNVQLVYCEDVVVSGLSTYQQRHVEGTDAIIIDSSKRVRVSGCALSSGADCVGIKSGYNEDGRRVNLPAEDILVTNCHFYHSAGAAVGIGSETAGSIRNIVIGNSVVEDCYRGMHIRSPRGRGGVVEKLQVDNLVFDQIDDIVIKVSHFYDSVRMEGRHAFRTQPGRTNLEIARSRKAAVDEGTPSFRDFTFSNLTLGRVVDVAVFEGLPERHIQRLVFQNVTATHARGGIACSMTNDVSISNVVVDSLETPVLDARDSQRLEIHRLKCARPAADGPAIWLENVAGAFLHGCDIGSAGAGFAWCRQEESRGIAFGANNVPPLPAAPSAPAPASAAPAPARKKI